MILRRLGNKRKIAHILEKYFPEHTTYVEPFFGAGGMFFNKRMAKHNIVNDLDSDVYNLYKVIKNDKERLLYELQLMPIHRDLFQHWRNNDEIEPLMQAVRFLFLSNFSLYGKMDCMRYGGWNSKQLILENIENFAFMIQNVQFSNVDFGVFLETITTSLSEKNSFIYADPPYLNTVDNYTENFNESDVIRLFDALENTKCKFAYSEFNNDFILKEAKNRGLNVVEIAERRTLGNRNTEILIMNYDYKTESYHNKQKLF